MIIANQCQYCFDEKIRAVNKKQWMIHLWRHRSDIICNLSQISSRCMLCPCTVQFTGHSDAASHYRHNHKQKDIVRWAFSRLPQIFVPIINTGDVDES